MRKSLLACIVIALVVSAGAPSARAENGHPFGLGIMLGAPTGLSGKLYLGGKPFALDFGLGVVEEFYEDGLHLHMDVIWHPVVLTRTADFTLPFYLGVGGRILFHDYPAYQQGGVVYNDHDTHIGVRGPFGLLMDFNKVPLDVFFEIALVVDLFVATNYGPTVYNRRYVDLNADIGLRYYF